MSGVPIVAVKIEHYCFNHSERAPGDTGVKLKLAAISDFKGWVTNVMDFKAIDALPDDQVKSYLNDKEMSASELLNEVEQFEGMLGRVRGKLIQSKAAKSDSGKYPAVEAELSSEAGSSSQHKFSKKRKLQADAQPTLVTSAHTPKLVEHQPDQQEPTSSKKDIARPSQQGVPLVKKKRIPTETAMDWPHTIDVLVGDIEEKMNRLRDAKGGCPKDLQPCWYALISGHYGDAIKELLITIVVSERPKSQLSELQKRVVDSGIIELSEGENEAVINSRQSRQLKKYLTERIFNGKMVAFKFADFCKFIETIDGYRECYDIPARLCWLGDEIRRVIHCTHFEKGITLEENEGWDQLCKSRLKKPIIDLMSVISLTGSDRVGELRKLQEKLQCVIKKNLPFVASSFDGEDEKITPKQAEDFYKYIKNICCRSDLIRIDFNKLRIRLTTIDDISGVDNDEEMSFQYQSG
ncbi:hypothetical protein [Endozoicomonas sp.]|uniref:hypothetical protein n=1 Tax=Endozoicomonas sp. TaxID=1892382 RepID=UPI003AF8A334